MYLKPPAVIGTRERGRSDQKGEVLGDESRTFRFNGINKFSTTSKLPHASYPFMHYEKNDRFITLHDRDIGQGDTVFGGALIP